MIYLILSIVFLSIAFINESYFHGSLLYPPTLFCVVWGISFFCLSLFGDTFYKISIETSIIYIIAALAISIGGFLASVLPHRLAIVRYNESMKLLGSDRKKIRFFLDATALISLVVFPFFYWNLSSASGSDIFDTQYFAIQRMQSIDQYNMHERSFSVLNNFPIITMFIALTMQFEMDRSKRRILFWLGSVILSILYQVISGTKGVLINLPLILMFAYFFQRTGFNWKFAGSVISTILVLFGISILYVNLAYTNNNLWESLDILATSVSGYWLGGFVAFDQVVNDPLSVSSGHNISRFFLETANGLGARFEIPSLHLEFVYIGSALGEYNTYTILVSYYRDFGVVGVLVGMVGIGFVTTYIARMALNGGVVSLGLAAFFAQGIILSVHAEHFFLALNVLIKLILFIFFVYYFIGRIGILHTDVSGIKS